MKVVHFPPTNHLLKVEARAEAAIMDKTYLGYHS